MSTKALFRAFESGHGYQFQLWVSDGTAGGTYALSNVAYSPQYITAIGNGKAVFSANSSGSGTELWVTNGTAAGTYQLDDINPGSASSNPTHMTSLGNGEVLFAATEPTDGLELWITDGTSAGTHLLKDIRPGPFGGISPNPYFAELSPGKAVFRASDPSHGIELWVTDGTTPGTYVIDISPGHYNSFASNMTAIGNGTALFKAYKYGSSQGYELWTTNGTAAGTHLVKDIVPGPGNANISDIVSLGDGKGVFSADVSANVVPGGTGTELWVSNGTAAGTYGIDIYPGAAGSFPTDITAFGNGKALFAAESDSAHGTELWITDGTAAGTHMVADVNPGTGSSNPRYITSLGNGKALFSANDGTHGTELWVTDGTALGTNLVKDIYFGSGSSTPYDITSLGNGTAMFRATDGNPHGAELWISDGTAAGTHLVDDIIPGPNTSDLGLITELAPCYCPGTLIRTARGDKRVEKLKIGDKVITMSGAARPIKWIGRRGYSGRFIQSSKDILPVCIKAGALDDDVPKRDLWISPHHAMFLDGVLIEAKDLVNGISIVQAEHVEKVEYFHIELDTHDVIIADGALSETYLDDDNRSMFHNAQDYFALYQDVAATVRYCAPRLEEGYEVEVARQRIALRAGLLRIADGERIGTLRGYVDEASARCISGWAQTIEHPEARVCVDIYARGRLIGRTLANAYREDLEQAGLGSGCHSFAFALSSGDVFAPSEIEVRRSADQALLKLSNTAKAAAAAAA
jgi:ELWxxDGT repeat protein